MTYLTTCLTTVFVNRASGPLLYSSYYNACCGMHWWSIYIIRPNQQSCFSLIVVSMRFYLVLALTSTVVVPNMSSIHYI